MQTFSSNLRMIRKSKGMTQKELAGELGYQYNGIISTWERGISFPDLKTFMRLIDALECSPNDLLLSHQGIHNTVHFPDTIIQEPFESFISKEHSDYKEMLTKRAEMIDVKNSLLVSKSNTEIAWFLQKHCAMEGYVTALAVKMLFMGKKVPSRYLFRCIMAFLTDRYNIVLDDDDE